MAVAPTFDAAWHRWVCENLARGCTPESVVAAMVRDHFSPDEARMHVARVAGAAPAHDSDDAPRLPQDEPWIRTPDRSVRISLRMRRPVIAVFDDLLAPDECDELIRQSELKLERSTVVDPMTGRRRTIADRGSCNAFFQLRENEFIARLDRRIAAAMHWPAENGEGLQILRYGVGGEYKPHFDYFPPADPGSAVHLARGGQRVSTLVMYLNDVEAGGETVFPEIGLEIVPRRGAAVYFEYCDRAGRLDPRTLHGGRPVRAGQKWIATKWMRQRRYAED
jgi:prolyl 4-hydroxylase